MSRDRIPLRAGLDGRCGNRRAAGTGRTRRSPEGPSRVGVDVTIHFTGRMDMMGDLSDAEGYVGSMAPRCGRPIPAHPIPQYRLAASFRWSNVCGSKASSGVKEWGVRACGRGRYSKESLGSFAVAIGRSGTTCAVRVRSGWQRTAGCRRVSGDRRDRAETSAAQAQGSAPTTGPLGGHQGCAQTHPAACA